MPERDLLYFLEKIQETLCRIISNSSILHSADDYYNSPQGMERLESTCMLLIAIGESLKNIDRKTDGKLLSLYPEVDWKGAKGLRDIIAHGYFDLNGDVVFDVVKNDLPIMLTTIEKMISDIKTDFTSKD